ncbi:MAG TPA: TIGR03960 family B12-binding radical SAM protein [Myxococcales bacterium]|nr:TIGR03960 family B12-binding radical SAM protein [Myxococcales bacterium]
MRLPVLDRLILSAQRPSRYAGGELNAVRKDLAAARVKWALAFPDTYEVGMSNVGFRLLYHALNERPDVACERVFMPWPDMEAALRAERLPLFSIESRAPIAAFDILGFTLQFELCYTTVLAMLDLGGIALHTKDRKRDDPLVLGGGPCTYNPEPVADFFDAFVIGEGEEVVHEISDAVAAWKESGAPRDHLLWVLAEIPGVYVPSLFRVHYAADKTIACYEPLKPGYQSIVRRVIPDLNLVPQAEKPIVPFMQTVHDRLPLEIQRGCTRGCRFCQVGMITRPTRQRDPNDVRRIAERGLEATGYEEVGFLSLSAGDYSCIDGVLEDFFDEFGPENVGISLPSLRTETMSERLAGQIKRVRKSGFTVAPEAATERMRRVINKGNSEKDLLHAVDTVFSAGWDLVKFYFMIGLPTEQDEDVRAIVNLCGEALRRGRKLNPRAEINVGVSTFCPKPFTPFQWDPMISLEETQRKQALLRDELRKLGRGYRELHVKPHDARQGALEGALALGDRRLATAVLGAYRRGQRLDGWTEHFHLEVWHEAFALAEREHGVGMHFFAHREKGEREVLPFDHIDCEVTKPYLWKARMASLRESQVPDCAYGEEICTACGACDYEVVDNIVYHPEDYRRQPPRVPAEVPAGRTLLRLRYAKEGVAAVALSHLETMTALLRTFRRAKLSIPHSQGFHPKPKVSFGPACPVGTESRAEYLDLELFGVQDAGQVAGAVRVHLPEGFRLLSCEVLAPGGDSLARTIRGIVYRVELPDDAPDAAQRLAEFASSGEAIIVREREGKRPVRVDLKASVEGLAADGPREVRFTLKAGEPEAVARPSELLSALFGAELVKPGRSRLIRESVVFGPPAA